jgi:putative SOS response-associated peptidase YedK
MCGRFALGIPAKILTEYFQTANGPSQPERFNIAPSQPVDGVVRQGDDRVFRVFKWGLVPFWAKAPGSGPRPINIRAESVLGKPAFKGAFRRHRCLVPAQGFYEWKPTEHGKEPFFIARADGAPLGLAGLWDRWEGDGEALDTCAILTTRANELVAPIHDRMPVIIDPAEFDLWLGAADPGPAGLASLLQPYPARSLRAWRVDTRVNAAKTDDPDLVRPAPPDGSPAPA